MSAGIFDGKTRWEVETATRIWRLRFSGNRVIVSSAPLGSRHPTEEDWLSLERFVSGKGVFMIDPPSAWIDDIRAQARASNPPPAPTKPHPNDGEEIVFVPPVPWWERLMFRRAIPSNEAVIRTDRAGEREVFFGTARVIPLVHSAERVDLRVKPITVERIGKHGVATRDDYWLDVRVTFFMELSGMHGVLAAADAIGAQKTFDGQALAELMAPSFHELLRQAVACVDAKAVLADHIVLSDVLFKLISLDGDYFSYGLDDIRVDMIRERLHVD